MPPIRLRCNGLQARNEFTDHKALAVQILKRYQDPNDVGCHGWDCYTSAEKTGIIFMSIIVPMVLFLIFWFLVIRPMDDFSIASDLSDMEQPDTQHAPGTVQQPQSSAQPVQDNQAEDQPGNSQPVVSLAPASPTKPHEPSPAPASPHPASLPQSQQTPVHSLLKLPATAVSDKTSSPAMHQSPAVVVNFNTPPITSAFASPPRDSAIGSPAKCSPVQQPGQAKAQLSPEQQQQQQQQPELPEQPLESSFTMPPGQLPEPCLAPGPPGTQGLPQTSRLPFPPVPPFPPGMPNQASGNPIYVAAPQFLTVLPPPPPPLAGQPSQPFSASSGPNFLSQIPQITPHGPPTAPPGFRVRLPHIISPQSQSQPSSPTTLNTLSSTAQQSIMSRSHRHPPLGRARTISDLQSDHDSSSHSRETAASGMTLPSETSSGHESSLRAAPSGRKGHKQTSRQGRKHKHTHDRRVDRRRDKQHSYRRHSKDSHGQTDKYRAARRQRPARRESSRSPSPHVRR